MTYEYPPWRYLLVDLLGYFIGILLLLLLLAGSSYLWHLVREGAQRARASRQGRR